MQMKHGASLLVFIFRIIMNRASSSSLYFSVNVIIISLENRDDLTPLKYRGFIPPAVTIMAYAPPLLSVHYGDKSWFSNKSETLVRCWLA